jgi:hypothetical protein
MDRRLGGLQRCNIKLNLREIGCEGVDWIQMGPTSGPCKHKNEPSGSIKGGEFLD